MDESEVAPNWHVFVSIFVQETKENMPFKPPATSPLAISCVSRTECQIYCLCRKCTKSYSKHSCFQPSCHISLFTSLGLGLGLRLRSNKPLTRNWYKSIHVTTLVAFYFYFCIIFKYYHTHEDGGVLNNTYSLQVLHTSKYGVVLGTPIQYYQCEIPLR